MRKHVLLLVVPLLLALAIKPVHGQQPTTLLMGAETLRGLSRSVGLLVVANRETPVSAEAVRDTVAAVLRASGFTVLGDDPNDPANYPLIVLDMNTSLFLLGTARQWLTIYGFSVRQRVTLPARPNVRFAAPTYYDNGWSLLGALQWHNIFRAAENQTNGFVREFNGVNPRR